jgi:hypothetical protein
LDFSLERWISDPRATEIEHQIQLAVDKQKRPDSSISGGDDSEAFPTSDDHQLASCSASASDQGAADLIEYMNRFNAIHRDNNGKDSLKHSQRRTRRKSSNSNEREAIDQ